MNSSIKDFSYKARNMINNSVKNIYEGSVSTAEKAGFFDIFNKLKSLEFFDDNDMTKIIIFLIAIIVIVCVIYALPKLNKSAYYEKKILNSKFVRFLICLFLIYAFYHYSVDAFVVILAIVFFIFWFHNGYSMEHMISDVIKEELDKEPAVVVKLESGEIVIDNIQKWKDEIREETEAELKKTSIIDKMKEGISTGVDKIKNIISPANEEEKIFDQRDFMIKPEEHKEQLNVYENLYDCSTFNN